jgi:hypothetical protein
MTDWHDIVDMINTFSEVFHLRHASTDAVTTQYPPVPTVINPTGVKRVSESTAESGSPESGEVKGEGAEQNSQGYTGELGASRGSSKNGARSASEVPETLQWRDIWPEL